MLIGFDYGDLAQAPGARLVVNGDVTYLRNDLVPDVGFGTNQHMMEKIVEFLGGKVTPGDVNNDGSIDLKDAIQGLKVVDGSWKSEESFIFLQNDVSGSGKSTLKNAIFVLQTIAGMGQ